MLEGPDGPGNIINRKNTIFYIEAIPQFFSQLRKKYFFAIDDRQSPKKFGKSRLLPNENHSNPIRELDAFPYAHRLESGNRTFLDIQEDFSGLGNAFAVLGAL